MSPTRGIALIIRGLGLGFLFTPINNVAYANLKPSEAQQASGLINLARQLGGSFGIAIITTFLDSQVAMHRAVLTANTYIENPAFVARQNATVAGLMAKGYSATAGQTGCVGHPRRVGHAAGHDAELQRRVDVDPGDVRVDCAGHSDPPAPEGPGPGWCGALGGRCGEADRSGVTPVNRGR